MIASTQHGRLAISCVLTYAVVVVVVGDGETGLTFSSHCARLKCVMRRGGIVGDSGQTPLSTSVLSPMFAKTLYEFSEYHNHYRYARLRWTCMRTCAHATRERPVITFGPANRRTDFHANMARRRIRCMRVWVVCACCFILCDKVS